MCTTDNRTILPGPGTKKDDVQLRIEFYLLQNILKGQNFLSLSLLLRGCRPLFLSRVIGEFRLFP